MKIKGIIHEDFVNYKKPSMVVEFPYCTFKCGMEECQNSDLVNAPDIEMPIEKIVNMYTENPITEAIVMQGLEPFDSLDDLLELVKTFREKTSDDIVIFTGYSEDDISIKLLQQFENVVVKFGGYVAGDEPHFDEVLGVNLVSKNQYARRIS